MLRRFTRTILQTLTGIGLGAWALTAAATDEAAGTPRIIAAWPAGPLDARIAFDRPLDPAWAPRLVGSAIHFDPRFRRVPVWRAAGSPALVPSGTLRIAAARLEDQGRTLLLATDPHSLEAVYTLGLPDRGGPTRARVPSLEVHYDLSGAEASWESERGAAVLSGSEWLPDIDIEASRSLTAGSAAHERGRSLLRKRGRLALSTRVVLPPGRLTLQLESNTALEATLGGEAGESVGSRVARFRLESTGDPIFLSATIGTGAGGAPPTLRATYQTEGDPAPKPLERDRQFVPWSPTTPAPPQAPSPPPFDLAGGDRARGEAVFFGDQAKCAQCHQVRGKGGTVGPDLSAAARRSRAELYRDIADPSAAIHPDYVPYTVSLRDGRLAVGIVRAEGADAIRVTATDARTTTVLRTEIEELRPTNTSIMPVGLAGVVGEEAMRDLLAFLTESPASSPVPRGR